MVQKLKPADLKQTGKVVVGLTGGFGSGKSTVAHLFEELGAFTIDADKLAHEALRQDSPVFAQVAALFKDAVKKATKEIDRKVIAEIVFKDTAKRKRLEAVIHPYVFSRIVEEAADSLPTVVVIEVPLLFETGFDQFCHFTVVVKAPDAAVNGRLLKKNFTLCDVQARRKAQWPLADKEKRATYIIDNSQTFQKTKREVQKIWHELLPVSKGVS